MNFTDSISYAIKVEHLPKALTIVLVGIIVSVSILVLAVALQAPLMAILILPVILAYHLFVNGYKLSVTRAVMQGKEQLPDLRMGHNIGLGAVIFLATLIYSIPFIVLYMVVGGLIFATREAGAVMFLSVCGGMLMLVLGVIAISMSFYVGLARYAAEDNAGALFNVGKNLGIVMSNLGITGSFLWRVIGIAMAFSILGTMITNVISPFFSTSIQDAAEAMIYNDMQALSSLTIPLLTLGTIYYTITLVANLISGFSISHLVAGFGAELGFVSDKLKVNESDNNSTAIVMVILAFVIVFGLVACAAFTFMSLLGPEIGDVFSEIMRELEATQ